MNHPVRFGLFLGQANKPYGQILDEFREAEELGFHSAWLVDHLVDTDGPPEHPMLEAWTLLAGLAVQTTRLRLGVLVTNNLFRHPSLLMKEAVTVDHMSSGRLVLGLGSGWHEDEHRRYGFDFPGGRQRVERLEEAVAVIESLQRQARTTFQGRHYQLEDAPLEPRPLQQPRIPLLIAAHRPRMLRLAARAADIWDTFPTLPGTATAGVARDVSDRIRQLDAYCAEIGRDPAQIRRSIWAGGENLSSVDRFLEFVERHGAMGFTDFTAAPGTPAAWTVVRALAAHVARSAGVAPI